MELRPALQIQTVIKAMADVVLPAVDPHNKLAQEQARLVIGMLSLLAERLPLLYRYECDELSRFLVLAETLREAANEVRGASQALRDLTAVVEVGSSVLTRARAEPRELEAANFELREKIGALVTAVYADPDCAQCKTIGTAVTAHAKDQLLRERAWLAIQGWEGDGSALPAIESLLGTGPLGHD